VDFISRLQASKAGQLNFFPSYDSNMDGSWWQRADAKRKERGWSKAELARRADLSPTNVSKYLAGRVAQPRGDALQRIAQALDISPLQLWMGLETNGLDLIYFSGHGDADHAFLAEAKPTFTTNQLQAIETNEQFALVVTKGSIIHWSKRWPASELLNKFAVVKIAGGDITFRTIRNGTKPGYFTLTSMNAEDLIDVIVDWAAPIDLIRLGR
jgi:transcriptional regulator with XRE-family HTH domain